MGQLQHINPAIFTCQVMNPGNIIVPDLGNWSLTFMVELTTQEMINLRYISASSYGEECYVDVNRNLMVFITVCCA